MLSSRIIGLARVVDRALQPGMIRFDRARNGDGEFAPQVEGGPDPATMRAAYGPVAPVSKVRNALRLAADAGGAAGGALTVGSMVARKLRRAV